MTDNVGNQIIGIDWKFDHIGVVARDVDKAYEQFKAAGLGNDVPQRILGQDVPQRIQMGGKKASLKGMLVKMGPVMMEIWQPVKGNTIQQEFLDNLGEGVNHICFSVDDIEKERARLTELGIRIVFSAKDAIGEGSYFDTRAFCNLALELVQMIKK
jgi:methylmalonyl-CoA/ethylmalonyl-CoA epimerase